MTLVKPPGVSAEGNVKVVGVSTIASIDAPTVTEVAAGTDLSCYMKYPFQPGFTQNGVQDQRFCSASVGQAPGRVQWNVIEMNYVYQPQPASPSTNNEAHDFLVPDSTVYLVVAVGIAGDAETSALVAATVVDVYECVCGPYNKVLPDGQTEGQLLQIQQQLFPGDVRQDVALAAAA